MHDRIALTARALQPAAPCIIFLPACLICARMRGQMDEWPPKVGFAGDSPLEEAGFELPKIEHLAEGTESLRTRRWSKGDSNSWSHPERERSEGATWVPPLLPVSESRPPEKRQRSAELSATVSAVATPFHVGVPNAHAPIALSSIVRIASIVTGSFRLSSMRRTRMELHDGNWT